MDDIYSYIMIMDFMYGYIMIFVLLLLYTYMILTYKQINNEINDKNENNNIYYFSDGDIIIYDS